MRVSAGGNVLLARDSGSRLDLYDDGRPVLSVVDPTLIPAAGTGTGRAKFAAVSVTARRSSTAHSLREILANIRTMCMGIGFLCLGHIKA